MIVPIPVILRPSLIKIDHVAARLGHYGTRAECQDAANEKWHSERGDNRYNAVVSMHGDSLGYAG